jgi:hypothetical protein
LRSDERVRVDRGGRVERSGALTVLVKSRRSLGLARRNDRFGFRIGEERGRLFR